MRGVAFVAVLVVGVLALAFAQAASRGGSDGAQAAPAAQDTTTPTATTTPAATATPTGTVAGATEAPAAGGGGLGSDGGVPIGTWAAIGGGALLALAAAAVAFARWRSTEI